MDKHFWVNMASCWIKLWSKEDEESTQENIVNILADVMGKREREKSMAEQLMGADMEDLEWLFN